MIKLVGSFPRDYRITSFHRGGRGDVRASGLLVRATICHHLPEDLHEPASGRFFAGQVALPRALAPQWRTATVVIVFQPLVGLLGMVAYLGLGTRPRNIMTLPVEMSGGKYIVYGQSPADGADVTMLECTFGSDGTYIGIKITGRPEGDGSADDGGAPPAAMARCTDMVGVPAKVEVVSPLRPGFTEIILRENASGRRIACTASDAGEITNWVELN